MAVRVKLVCVCVLVFLLGAGLTAWAAPSTPPTYTGCLVTSTGAIVKVKRGSSPLSACSGSETAIKLSSGDITEIATAAGSGLTGGVAFGVANLSLNFGTLDGRYEGKSPATRACFDVALAEGADLSSCYLDRIAAEGATLIDADLRFADLTGADLSNSVMTRANLSRAVLRFADLRTAFMPNANLTRTNLYGALMEGANITGVTWQNTVCPDGTLSNGHGDTCDGHLSPTTP
jgi:hypothetical protein